MLTCTQVSLTEDELYLLVGEREASRDGLDISGPADGPCVEQLDYAGPADGEIEADNFYFTARVELNGGPAEKTRQALEVLATEQLSKSSHRKIFLRTESICSDQDFYPASLHFLLLRLRYAAV